VLNSSLGTKLGIRLPPNVKTTPSCASALEKTCPSGVSFTAGEKYFEEDLKRNLERPQGAE